jgi:hypothetical protein
MDDPNDEPKKELLNGNANTVSCPAFPVRHRQRTPTAVAGHLPVVVGTAKQVHAVHLPVAGNEVERNRPCFSQ